MIYTPRSQEKDRHDIDHDNYYFVQVFPENGMAWAGCEHLVCFAETPKDAEKKVRAWARENKIALRDTEGYNLHAPFGSIHFYHKNYKRDSRKMVEAGEYIS